MPLSEWKLRNSSSRTAAVGSALADRLLERQQRAADRGEVLLALGEVVVEEAVEKVGHRAPSTVRVASSSSRASAASACGVNGLVR